MASNLNTRFVGDSGTRDTRVDRIDEGLPGIATTDNPTANPPTRATLDAGLAVAGNNSITSKSPGREHPVAQIDTQFEYNGLDINASIKRGEPSKW